jgi:hypothetical protein
VLVIERTYYKNYTSGVMRLPNGDEFYSLELPWKNNEKNVSCIPEGEYFFKRDLTGKHTFFKIEAVYDRTYIEIHPANNTSQLQGCIAPCLKLVNGKAFSSLSACNKLLDFYGDNTNTKYLLQITELFN